MTPANATANVVVVARWMLTYVSDHFPLLDPQSNAVGWLSQSVTDSLKACQQQVVGMVDNVTRCADTRAAASTMCIVDVAVVCDSAKMASIITHGL